MRWLLLGLAVAGTAGCGLSKCRELCVQNADCVEQEVATFETTWEEWTGFADRSAYETACFGVFEDSLGSGAERGELRDTCKAELADDCGPTSP